MLHSSAWGMLKLRDSTFRMLAYIARATVAIRGGGASDNPQAQHCTSHATCMQVKITRRFGIRFREGRYVGGRIIRRAMVYGGQIRAGDRPGARAGAETEIKFKLDLVRGLGGYSWVRVRVRVRVRVITTLTFLGF